MDSTDHQAFVIPILLTILILLLSFYYLFSKPRNPKKPRTNKPPEPSGAWPIVGHLHLLSRGLPHITLGAMADKLGPAFTIRLGTRRALVVSSSEVAKECYITKDRAFASRPSSIALKLMGYNNAMFGFAPYGPYWRELRKIVVLELLSNRRLESLKKIWKSEIDLSMEELYDTWAMINKEEGGQVLKLDMKEWFGDLMMNIVVRLVVEKRCFGRSVYGGNEAEAELRRCQRALREFFRLVGLFLVEDAVPFMSWFDVLGHQREMKRIAKELDSLFQGWLEEHKRKRSSGGGEAKGDQDFMDVMLSVLEDSTIPTGIEDDTVIKATCLNIILAGSDTTVVAVTWALSLLLNNRHTLKKAQDELDAHVGKERHVDESDVKKLVYLQAIIKEAMRLYPPEPLSGPRESVEDTVVAGYHVPAGTRLIVNVWKIQREPSIWAEPLEFRPERFLTTHKGTDVWGQHFELIPFGSGRRLCAGAEFALQVIQLTLARLLHGFELTTPCGAPVDMSENAGLTNVKATPIEVHLSPRLPLKLYRKEGK